MIFVLLKYGLLLLKSNAGCAKVAIDTKDSPNYFLQISTVVMATNSVPKASIADHPKEQL